MKKIINEMKLRLPAISSNEAVARAVVTAFCAELNPTLEELADVRCAVSEAVTNVIVHAYPDSVGEDFVYISVRLYTPSEISVEISDRGCGIADIEAARRPAFTTGEPTERCGMGFLVMESFMDTLAVKSKVGRGTSVLMRKILNPSRKDGYES